MKLTRLYFARAVSLFCSLNLLVGGVLHEVSVVVFIISSMYLGQHPVSIVVNALFRTQQFPRAPLPILC